MIIPFSEAVKRLLDGNVVAFPTETVYGLGALACHDQAIAEVYAIKNRPSFNPLIVHCASLHQATTIGVFCPTALALAERFWPGPLSLVVPLRNDRINSKTGAADHDGEYYPLSKLATAGLATVALRVPDSAMALDLLEAVGPLVAPSANPSGRLSPTSAKHVEALFRGKVPVLASATSHASRSSRRGRGAPVHDEPCPIGLESTIIGVIPQNFHEDDVSSSSEAILLRPGGLPEEEIRAFLGTLSQDLDARRGAETFPKILAPGMLLRHYAPRIPLHKDQHGAKPHQAILTFGPALDLTPELLPEGAEVFPLSTNADLTEAAANLFRLLHHIDELNRFTSIAVMPIPDHGLGRAINDRLRRAAETSKK